MRYNDVPWGAAACKGVWTPLFFPKQGEYENLSELKTICEGCPILEECREYAIWNESYGFWGGMTAADRMKLRAKINRRKRAA